jgi:hypothetical protein
MSSWQTSCPSSSRPKGSIVGNLSVATLEGVTSFRRHSYSVNRSPKVSRDGEVGFGGMRQEIPNRGSPTPVLT